MSSTLTTGLTTPQSHLDLFSEIESRLTGADRPAVARLRKSAIARFGELGFPKERNEDWRFTNVGPIVRTPMSPASAPSKLTKPTNLPAGVVVTTLNEALTIHASLIEQYLGQVADYKTQPFAALNTAFWSDGVFIHVPAGTVVEDPIEIAKLVQPGGSQLWYRRVLIVMERGSQATIVEKYAGEEGSYLTNAVCEIVLGEDARVDHYKIQEESPQAFHLATTAVTQARSSNFSTHYIGFGGQLARNEVRVVFTGEGCEATVNGLYMGSDAQLMDNFTVIDHARPHCNSHELYKGILDGKSRGVFNGKIFVRPQAQKTDAKQTNQTLLLSDDATINTKPQLEIFADDVKCTHGATVGQLDEQQLFYLRSRGIGLEQARALLTFAFANDIVNRIKVAGLRDRLEHKLLATSHLPLLADIEDV